MLSKITASTVWKTLFLLALLLTLSHSAPLRRADSASASFPTIDGHVTFTQVDASNMQIDATITKGITDPDANNYTFTIGPTSATFAELGITIVVPGIAPFKTTTPGTVALLKGAPCSVSHNGEVIASATIG